MRPAQLVLALSLAVAATAARADVTLFSEDFESGLSQWTTGTAQIVSDPADPFRTNHAVHFTELVGGGDIFIKLPVFAPSQIYTINFDYLSAGRKGEPTNDLGGFVGIGDGTPGSHTWIAGTQAGYQGIVTQLVHNGTWTTYSITVDANSEAFEFWGASMKDKPLYLMLEDFSGSGGVAGDVYFDNITITAAVPEPETYAMMIAGLGLIGMMARRRRS